MKTLLNSILLLGLIAVITSCGGPQQQGDQAGERSETKALSGAIKIDGSSTVYPITEAVAEEFRAVQPTIGFAASTLPAAFLPLRNRKLAISKLT